MNTFGERIAKLRNNLGYSQQTLADQLEISKSALAMYEKCNREPNFAITIKIADYFNVSVDYLIGRTNHSQVVQSEDREDTCRPVSLESTVTDLRQGLQKGQYTLGDQPLPESITKFAMVSLDAIHSLVHAFQEIQPTKKHEC